MKPLTELCLGELSLGGVTSAEMAAILGIDVAKVAGALSDLWESGKVDRKRLETARRVYFYFLKQEKRPVKTVQPTNSTQAGPAYCRQFKWI